MPNDERRLAAIMFTDMVGYTALAQMNEPLSLALLKDQRKLVRPILNKHRGVEVKTIGDAFLVEFPSALDAAECAYDIQQSAREFNLSQPSDRRIRLRIGLHLGDVVESQGDISGDAVNVASRIQSLAEDGGVCVTRQVYDHVKNKLKLPLRSLGSKSLKNVAEPIEVYRMELPWQQELLARAAYLDASRVAVLPQALDRKRVAVLPLVSVSPNSDDAYFADGMTEEIISTLSKISRLTVISRTSVMQYKGAKKNLTDIGRELKTGTILEGSVRKAGNRVRISVQLLDALEDKHVWAESYDRDLHDIFAVQSDIATSVAEVLKVKLLTNEANQIRKKPTESDRAYLLYLKGRQHWSKGSEGDVKKAIEYFTSAINEDPNFALAYAGLADCYTAIVDPGYIVPAETAEKARPAILKALELDQRLAEAHAAYGTILLKDWSWDASEAEFKKAIELNPSYSIARLWYSLLLSAEGRLEEALAESKMALELDPLAPMMSHNLGFRLCDLGRYDEAIEYFKRSLTIEPNFLYAWLGLAAAHNMKREFDKAMVLLEKWAQVFPSKAEAIVALAMVQARAGKKDKALSTLDSAMKLQASAKIPASRVAMVFAALDDEDRTLDWLERALTEHDPGIAHIKALPFYKNFRSNPRFLEILKKMGLDKY